MPEYITRTGRRIWCSRGELYRKENLPHGKWTCDDGRQVLFNRFYEPIWQRHPGAAAEPADDPHEWVPWKEQIWFYDDGHNERQKRSRAIIALAEFGVVSNSAHQPA
jgi:hypothetical protein